MTSIEILKAIDEEIARLQAARAVIVGFIKEPIAEQEKVPEIKKETPKRRRKKGAKMYHGYTSDTTLLSRAGMNTYKGPLKKARVLVDVCNALNVPFVCDNNIHHRYVSDKDADKVVEGLRNWLAVI